LKDPKFVRGIVTLGTPHEGTAVACENPEGVSFLGLRFVLPSPGLSSLCDGLKGTQVEEAPIFAHGGDISTASNLQAGVYLLTYRELYNLGFPMNDGMVPTPSALPAFISRGVRHPAIVYHHTELKTGRSESGDKHLLSVVADMWDAMALKSGSGTPTIDGRYSDAEWAGAGMKTFVLKDVATGENLPGTLRILNDDRNLYITVRVAGDFATGERSVGTSFIFDNDNSGEDKEGGDSFSYYVVFTDEVWVPCQTGGWSLCLDVDTSWGGSVDGKGASAASSQYYTIELSHPLASGDRRDFAVKSGAILGIRGSVGVFSKSSGSRPLVVIEPSFAVKIK
jgi:hypothetical protein